MLRGASMVCLALFCVGAFAQNLDRNSEAAAVSSSRPVAFVYVSSLISPNSSTKHELYAYAAAANGRLTQIAGSPFNYDATDVWVDKLYLFGLSGTLIDSYAIESNGSLHLAASIDAAAHSANFCGGIGPLKIDHSGQDVYNAIAQGDCMGFSFQTFGIDSANGKLAYKDTSPEIFLGGSEIDFLGNDKFAYSPICIFFDHEEVGYITGLRRQSNGTLTSITVNNAGPVPKDTSNSYCPYTIATDPTDHMAVLQQEEGFDGTLYGPPVIATYTANASGNLTTTSTYLNMPHTRPGSLVMRMSPSGKLLAVGGAGGLEIFHYNGANPATYYKTLLTAQSIQALYWDDSSHIYAVEASDTGKGKLYVFTVTPTSASQAPGSPYSIPNPDSLNVRPN